MPEVDDEACTVDEMTDDELAQAVEDAIDAGDDADSEEVMGFAPRDS